MLSGEKIWQPHCRSLQALLYRSFKAHVHLQLPIKINGAQ